MCAKNKVVASKMELTTLKPPTVKERDIQRAVKEALQWRGWLVVKIHQSLGSHKGIADLYCLRNGQHVWIEIKTAKGRLSEHQRIFKADIEAAGGKYCVARAVEDILDL